MLVFEINYNAVTSRFMLKLSKIFSIDLIIYSRCNVFFTKRKFECLVY